ncbi:hypothetical protein D1872_211290 [compost metagenome]
MNHHLFVMRMRMTDDKMEFRFGEVRFEHLLRRRSQAARRHDFDPACTGLINLGETPSQMLNPAGIGRPQHIAAGLYPQGLPIVLDDMPHGPGPNPARIPRRRHAGAQGGFKGPGLHHFHFMRIPLQLIGMVKIGPGQMGMQIDHARTDPELPGRLIRFGWTARIGFGNRGEPAVSDRDVIPFLPHPRYIHLMKGLGLRCRAFADHGLIPPILS